MTTNAATILMTVTLILALTKVSRANWTSLKIDELYLEHKREKLQELLLERNAWALRHLGCGLGALVIIWISKSSHGMQIPSQLTEVLAVYAATFLCSAGLESLLAQKITSILASDPVRVR